MYSDFYCWNFQEFLVERHIDTEEKLRKQAERLLVVSTEATGDREKLHDKLERKM